MCSTKSVPYRYIPTGSRLPASPKLSERALRVPYKSQMCDARTAIYTGCPIIKWSLLLSTSGGRYIRTEKSFVLSENLFTFSHIAPAKVHEKSFFIANHKFFFEILRFSSENTGNPEKKLRFSFKNFNPFQENLFFHQLSLGQGT